MPCREILFITVSLSLVVYIKSTHYSPVYDTVGTHNLTMGRRVNKDKLLYNETILLNASTLDAIVTQNVQFPPPENPYDYNITQILVKNIGNVGYVHRLSGGPGKGFVVFHLEAEENKGFEFQLCIYGYKRDYV